MGVLGGLTNLFGRHRGYDAEDLARYVGVTLVTLGDTEKSSPGKQAVHVERVTEPVPEAAFHSALLLDAEESRVEERTATAPAPRPKEPQAASNAPTAAGYSASRPQEPQAAPSFPSTMGYPAPADAARTALPPEAMPMPTAAGHVGSGGARVPRPGRPRQESAFFGGKPDVATALKNMDAPFSTVLLQLIDARGLRDAQVYRRANMSRQLFSRIRSDAHYQPSKRTVLALAVALELSLSETSMLLERAGYAFSHANVADVIVEYFIKNGQYSVMDINEALYAYDQPLL